MNSLVVSESISKIVSFIVRVRTLLIVSALVDVPPYVVYYANDRVAKGTSLTLIADILSSASSTGRGAIRCCSVCPFDSAGVSFNVGNDHLRAIQCRSQVSSCVSQWRP